MLKWLYLLEPIAVLLAVGIAVRVILPLVGCDTSAIESALVDGDRPDWTTAAAFESIRQGLRWGLLTIIALVLARVRRFRLVAPFGNQTSPCTIGQQVLLGLALGALLLPIATIPRWYHYYVAPIGRVPPIWDLIYRSHWDWSFWLYMAVASFALIPIVEEIYFRGYVLGSFNLQFGPVGAVILSAIVFQAVHLQYFRWDAFALYNSIGVLLMAMTGAWIVYRMNSLIPAVVMHAYGNVPRPASWALYELTLLLPAGIAVYALLRPSRAADRGQHD